jgi:hypothetical protein
MAKSTKSVAKSRQPGKRVVENTKRHSDTAARRTSAGGESKPSASSSRSWGWETLAGVIGEKCFRMADSTRQEVARWWYDPQEATLKFRWKAGNADGRNPSPAEAREQILEALARPN